MPPIIVTTCCPTANSPPGHCATTPAASMPRTRGNVTPDASPARVCNSDRFSPNALTSISTQPAAGVGTGSSRIVSASGGPGASRTIARMMSVIHPSTALRLVGVATPSPAHGHAGPLDRGDDMAPDGSRAGTPCVVRQLDGTTRASVAWDHFVGVNVGDATIVGVESEG